jgi:hypothetical protein
VRKYDVGKTPITAHLWGLRRQNDEASQFAKTAETYANLIAKEKIITVAKTPAESRVSVRYEFSKDTNLKDMYVNVFGNVLIGKIFEDLDAMAGSVITCFSFIF